MMSFFFMDLAAAAATLRDDIGCGFNGEYSIGN